MSNAAHIQVPSAAPDAPSPAATLTPASSSREVDAVFDGIDALLAACRGASVIDRLTALIPALIERGMNTRPRVVGAARKKGFNEERTSRFLTEMTGELWLRGKDGIYTVTS